MLHTLPFNQAVTLLTNTARADTKERTVLALQNIDRLLQNTEEKLVKENTKDIVQCLLKSYSSPDSAVRKHSGHTWSHSPARRGNFCHCTFSDRSRKCN